MNSGDLPFSAVKSIAAMVALALVMTGAGCTRHKHAASTASTALTVPPGRNLDNGCHKVFASTSIAGPFGPLQTIPPRQQPVAYEVAVSPVVACPGGQVRIAVRAHNEGSKTITTVAGVVLFGRGGGRSVNCNCGFLNLAPGATRTITSTFLVPVDAPPGRYEVTFADFDTNDKHATLLLTTAAS